MIIISAYALKFTSENNDDVDNEDNIKTNIDIDIDDADDENDEISNELFIIGGINLMQAEDVNKNEDNKETNVENKNDNNNFHKRKEKHMKK